MLGKKALYLMNTEPFKNTFVLRPKSIFNF